MQLQTALACHFSYLSERVCHNGPFFIRCHLQLSCIPQRATNCHCRPSLWTPNKSCLDSPFSFCSSPLHFFSKFHRIRGWPQSYFCWDLLQTASLKLRLEVRRRASHKARTIVFWRFHCGIFVEGVYRHTSYGFSLGEKLVTLSNFITQTRLLSDFSVYKNASGLSEFLANPEGQSCSRTKCLPCNSLAQ